MAWKAISQAFPAGPLPLDRMRGRRIRLRAPLLARAFDPEAPRGPEIALAEGCVGFVGHPGGAGIVLAFPRQRDRPVARLETLLGIGFDAVAVSAVTFQLYFEIED